jgi:ABC-type nickel/cobalt efflux system permease component RcnA
MIAALTGLVAGVIHVWSGPDHLAAIAPLAVRRPKRGWVPGARWGLGHSAGVLVIGLVSLWLRGWIPTEWLSAWGERLVGVMLIGIGAWALRKAFKVHTHEHEHDGARHLHVHAHHDHTEHDRREAHEDHTHAAFGIGILHGLAGSSHFFGVLTALALPTRLQAIEYLLAFGLGTVISMALFSSIMGSLSARFSGRSTMIYRGLMTACAVAAFGVGCFWLVT